MIKKMFVILLIALNLVIAQNTDSFRLRKFSFEGGIGIPEILKFHTKYQINSSTSLGIKFGRLFYSPTYGLSVSHYFNPTGERKFLMTNVISAEITFLKEKVIFWPGLSGPSHNWSIEFWLGHEHIKQKKIGLNFYYGVENLFNRTKVVAILLPAVHFSIKFNY